MRAPALISIHLLLAGCPAPREPVVDEPRASDASPEATDTTAAAAGATALSTPVPAPASTANPVPVDMTSPASTGPSRETLCEKALLELELAAAATIDRCVGPRPGSNQPITISVRVDETGHIGETKWDVSTTTGYGQKAANCILAAVKALPFEEPACSKEWLQVRRARQQPLNPLDIRF